MSQRLTYPQRLGLILTAILALLAVIAIALMPAPKAAIPEYPTPEPIKADPVKSAVEQKRSTKPAPPHPARSPLDETF